MRRISEPEPVEVGFVFTLGMVFQNQRRRQTKLGQPGLNGRA
jgi:hypothetical protein